ncbi:MAG: alpha/beta hydrolase [Anaerolineales bacterium]
MKTQYIKQQHGQIAYDVTGNGPLVICVPSMGDLRSEYRFLVPQVAKAGYRVVTMDVRGHGETSVDWDDFSVAGVGADIVALVRELKSGPAIIVGTSMAAGATVWAAAEAPELIHGMILSGPFIGGEGTWISNLMFSTLFARPWGAAMWIQYYSTLYPSKKPTDFKEYSASLRENLKERGRLEALVKMITASKKASEVRIPKVSQPVLVLMGSKDLDFKNPEEEAKLVAEQLRGMYTMIENAGHYPHAEMPEVVTPLMISFMNSLQKGN